MSRLKKDELAPRGYLWAATNRPPHSDGSRILHLRRDGSHWALCGAGGMSFCRVYEKDKRCPKCWSLAGSAPEKTE